MDYEALLRNIYEKFAPEKLATVKKVLSYFVGREEDLLDVLEEKYGIEIFDNGEFEVVNPQVEEQENQPSSETKSIPQNKPSKENLPKVNEDEPDNQSVSSRVSNKSTKSIKHGENALETNNESAAPIATKKERSVSSVSTKSSSKNSSKKKSHKSSKHRSSHSKSNGPSSRSKHALTTESDEQASINSRPSSIKVDNQSITSQASSKTKENSWQDFIDQEVESQPSLEESSVKSHTSKPKDVTPASSGASVDNASQSSQSSKYRKLLEARERNESDDTVSSRAVEDYPEESSRYSRKKGIDSSDHSSTSTSKSRKSKPSSSSSSSSKRSRKSSKSSSKKSSKSTRKEHKRKSRISDTNVDDVYNAKQDQGDFEFENPVLSKRKESEQTATVDSNSSNPEDGSDDITDQEIVDHASISSRKSRSKSSRNGRIISTGEGYINEEGSVVSKHSSARKRSSRRKKEKSKKDSSLVKKLKKRKPKEKEKSRLRRDAGCFCCIFIPLVGVIAGIVVMQILDRKKFFDPNFPLLMHFQNAKIPQWEPSSARIVATPNLGEDFNDDIVEVFSKVLPANHPEGSFGLSNFVANAGPPMFELEWIKEDNMLIGSAPSIDNNGNLYISPMNILSQGQKVGEDALGLSLISLDGVTGERRFGISGNGTSLASPLILNEASDDGTQHVFQHISRNLLVAIDTAGNIVWEATSFLPADENRHNCDLVVNSKQNKNEPCHPDWIPFNGQHTLGLGYIATHDAIVGSTYDGKLFAVDRKTGETLSAPRQLNCAAFQTENFKKTQLESQQAFRLLEMKTQQKERALRNAYESKKREEQEATVLAGSQEVRFLFGNRDGVSAWEEYIHATVGKSEFQSCVHGPVATDPTSGRIFVLSSHQGDKKDGTLPRVMLARADLSEGDADGDHPFRIRVSKSLVYEKQHIYGNGVLALNDYGTMGYFATAAGYVEAVDVDAFQKMWSSKVGEEIIAPLAVATYGKDDEVYALGRKKLYKIVGGKIVWKAEFKSIFSSEKLAKATGAGPIKVTATQILVGVAASRTLKDDEISVKTILVSLDRGDGSIRNGAEAIESFAGIAVGFNAIYVSNTPNPSRVLAREMFNEKVPQIMGGVSRFKSTKPALHMRDIVCTMNVIASKASKPLKGWFGVAAGAVEAAKVDLKHLLQLWEELDGLSNKYFQASREQNTKHWEDLKKALYTSDDKVKNTMPTIEASTGVLCKVWT